MQRSVLSPGERAWIDRGCDRSQLGRSTSARCMWSQATSSHRAESEPVALLRRGFTLMEMMLVLAVLAVFASLTVPSVVRMYRARRLSEAAEHVRALAASARVRAIETGLIYQFCTETNGTHFVVAPFEPDHLNSGNVGQNGQPMSLASRASGNLPKGYTLTASFPGIVTTAGVTPAGHKIASGSLDGLPNAGELSNLNWSNPVLFNPDGAANSDTEITVTDSWSQEIRIRVRAFTGSVTMGRLTIRKR